MNKRSYYDDDGLNRCVACTQSVVVALKLVIFSKNVNISNRACSIVSYTLNFLSNLILAFFLILAKK